MLRTVLCVALVAAAEAQYGNWTLRPVVTTREGLVMGTSAKSASGNVYYSFKGIPYAQPPVGALRFRPPRRHTGWYGAVDAKEHGNVCLQIDAFGDVPLIGDENCLFANVYTRRLSPPQGAIGGLPVMVYIHGGLFLRGSGNDRYYGPSYFMDEDIVLVTFNYRLGAFGFLSTHDSNAPGNYGLLDQVTMLQWVQDNIASFGGDPNAVTIFGESAGGACVSLLVLSPLTRGLFHHAISQSGTAIANFAASGRKMGFERELAQKFGCPTDDVGELVECLRNVPAESLLATATPDEHLFQPRVDHEAESPVMPEDPRLLLERGDFNLVPWMNGNIKEEGWYFLPVLAINETVLMGIFAGDLNAWSLLADLTTKTESMLLECGADPVEEATKVKQFYAGEKPADINNLLPIAQVLSDRFFNAAMVTETLLAARHTAVYRYVFDYNGAGRLRWTDLSALDMPDMDPSHGDELLYLFSQSALPLEPEGSANRRLIRLMVRLWTSFARTGRPGAAGAPDWPIVTESSQKHMRLNLQPSTGQWLFEERTAFWQTVRVNEPWRRPVETAPCIDIRLSDDAGVALGQSQLLYGSLLAKGP